MDANSCPLPLERGAVVGMRRDFKVALAILLTVGSFLFVGATKAYAATYYIDYSTGSDANSGLSKTSPWQHQPYMKGFTGTYTHQAGDVFIFKGGVTWAYSASDPIFPMTIKAGGSTSAPDQYTVDKTWYDGSSYTPPIFDGCQTAEGLNVCGLNGAATLGANSYLIGDDTGIFNASNLTINGLQLQDIGDPVPAGGDDSGIAIDLLGSESNLTISNCTIIPHSRIGIAYSNNTAHNPLNTSGIYIYNNVIKDTTLAAFLTGSPNYTVNDVEVYNNTFYGAGNALGNIATQEGNHMDSIQVGCPAGCVANQITMTNIDLHDNKFIGLFSGPYTAMYYSNGGTSNTNIYNNVFGFENNTPETGQGVMTALLTFSHSVGFADYGNINIYNNTFSSDALTGYGIGANSGISFNSISNANPTSIDVRNNIFSGVAMGTVFGVGGAWAANTSYGTGYAIVTKSGTYYYWIVTTAGTSGSAQPTWPSSPAIGQTVADGSVVWTHEALPIVTENNLFNVTTTGGYGYLDNVIGNDYSTLSAAQAAGFESNSLGGNSYSSSYPGFVSLPNGTVGSGNWNLLNTSPAIKAGTNLSSTFTTDLNNITRPSTGAWTSAPTKPILLLPLSLQVLQLPPSHPAPPKPLFPSPPMKTPLANIPPLPIPAMPQ